MMRELYLSISTYLRLCSRALRCSVRHPATRTRPRCADANRLIIKPYIDENYAMKLKKKGWRNGVIPSHGCDDGVGHLEDPLVEVHLTAPLQNEGKSLMLRYGTAVVLVLSSSSAHHVLDGCLRTGAAAR
jgi:hypothetical protein